MFPSNGALAVEINRIHSNEFILDDIRPDFDQDLMTAKLKPAPPKVVAIFKALIREARTLARPRAAFKVCRVEPCSAAEVNLDGVSFTGELLHDNLDGLKWVYAYVATEGPELVQWAESLSNPMRLLSWSIRYTALKLAEIELCRYIKSAFGLKQISSMNPGSLSHWPIEQQEPLFELLSPLPEAISLKLLPNFWMSPALASSGIFFQTEVKFYNCQLCPLETCEHRRTAFRGKSGWPQRKNVIGEAA